MVKVNKKAVADKRSKKRTTKKVSSVAKDLLGRVNSEVLFALNKIQEDLATKDAIFALVRQMIDEEKDYLLARDSGDPLLAVKHANAKGRISGLTYLCHLIEGSGDEIERREEKNG